jgi:hypothetical protein
MAFLWIKKKFFPVIQGGAVNHGIKCFKYLGPLVLLKHISGLKSTGKCVLGYQLTNYSIQTSFVLVAAYWLRQNERQFLLIFTTASQSHSAVVDGHREFKLV